MKRNAFDVLRNGSSAPTPRSKHAPKAQAGSGKDAAYVACPVCQRSFPVAFAQAHVSLCTAGNPTQCNVALKSPTLASQHAATPKQQPQLSTQSTQQEPTAKACSEDGRQCLIDLTSSDDVPAAVPTCSQGMGSIQGDGEGQRPAHAQGSEAAAKQHHAPQATPSAFDILRQGQARAAHQVQTFYLERTQDGQWRWHWWSKGRGPGPGRHPPSAVWSTTTTVKAGPQATGAAGKTMLHLHTNVPAGEGGLLLWDDARMPSNALPPEGRWRGGVGLLKSALQKAVRLGRGGCAVRLALALLKEDAGELLRRLSIVCVEDGLLHPGLPMVTWLMAAQAKGYALGAVHADALVRLVYQIASVSVRDQLPPPYGSAPAKADAGGSVQQEPASGMDALGTQEAALVRCLLLRAAYGGMAGDVQMLRGFADIWMRRFSGSAGPPPDAPPLPPSTTADAGLPQAAGEALPQLLSQAAQQVGSNQGGASGTCTSTPFGPNEQPATSSGPPLQGTQQTPPLARPHQHAASTEAYFAGRLQLPDAPPTCGTFVAASQLLTDQQREQSSLLGMYSAAAATPAATASQQQQQGQWQQPGLQGPGSNGRRASGWAIQQAHHTGPPSAGQVACGGTPGTAASSSMAVPGLPVPHPAEAPPTVPCSGVGGLEPGSRGTGVEPPRAAAAGRDAASSSVWLQHLVAVYHTVPVPPQLSSVRSIGALRRGDLPLSAVDFHVSDIVQHLASLPEVRAAGLQLVGGTCTPPNSLEDDLRSAMWLFRSSTSHKALLRCALPAQPRPASDSREAHAAGAGGKGGNERPSSQGLAGDDAPAAAAAQADEDAGERHALMPLWRAAAQHADRYAMQHILRRFGRPQ